MKRVKYKLAESGDFIIENFNKAKAFSSFFPGIAGLDGIPLWAFYVNRGQCISSFGSKDKDGAILEFFPANQAYALTSVKGFRTFLKLTKGGRAIFHEPFKEAEGNASGSASTRMIINPCKLEIEEVNRYLGIAINVSYITIPNEPFAALARSLSIKNISNKRVNLKVIDGLPHVISFGISEEYQKHISRTIEAWVKVSNLEVGVPFYALKVDPEDRPELEYIEGGNFYLSYEMTNKGAKLLRPIVDPDLVFGADADISYPRLFAQDGEFDPNAYQKTECKTPSAFSYSEFILGKGETKKINSIIGHIKDPGRLNSVIPRIKTESYFDIKSAENEDIISRLENSAFTKSSSNEFDFYCRQTFLDNLLRGGYPLSIDTLSGPFVFYAFARKHGDLERDYNAFLLQPSYYSQGNGSYRDINQNRRSDVFFNPDVKYDNLSTFVNAIQPDGFNPQSIEGITLSLRHPDFADLILKRYIDNPAERKKVKDFLAGSFTPGGLVFFLENGRILSKDKAKEFLRYILAVSTKTDIAKPREGYWTDHWTYNLDLIDSFLLCYPENLRELLFERRDFSFYDTYLRVNPRDEKYVYADGKIRQFGSVSEDKDKRRVIEGRTSHPFEVRIERGKGEIYRTSLFVKLCCLLVNKTASLDPFGIGMEMEAGKPGWCDSLNNLPGIFGSSVSEVFELKRLIIFLESSIGRIGLRDDFEVSFPYEIADFLTNLEKVLNGNLSSRSKNRDFEYWEASSSLKENYRRKVWPGFDGKERAITLRQIKAFLDKALIKIEYGLKRAESEKGRLPYTYFINEVKKYEFVCEKRRQKLSKKKMPIVKPVSFSHRSVSLFLEGPMHAMRVAKEGKRARSLYAAVRRSELFDKKLKMYKINAPLKDMPFELGRQIVFTPGWLENESIWLHMEYKYLLEVLKKGLYKEFFSDMRNCLVAFQDPDRYGRSILENSSFIASSAFPDKATAGNGFVARLTGSTTEFLNMWLLMSLGSQPFKIDERDRISFELKPVLPGRFFTKRKSAFRFYFNGGRKETVNLQKGIFAFCLLGKTLVVYHNAKRRDTFGKNSVKPTAFILKKNGRGDVKLYGNNVPSPLALRIREGYYDRIDVVLS